MWFYRAKTADLALRPRRGFSFFCGLWQKNFWVEHHLLEEGWISYVPSCRQDFQHSANWAGNGQSAPWVVSRRSCRWEGECDPSPAVTCGHLQDGNALLPSAVAVVKGTQNKALPSWCYLVSHTLLWVMLCWVLEHAKQVWKKELMFSPFFFSHQQNHTLSAN